METDYGQSNSESDAWVLNDGNETGRKYDLEERLLAFAAAVINLTECFLRRVQEITLRGKFFVPAPHPIQIMARQNQPSRAKISFTN